MLKSYLDQLNSSDAAQRRAAIIALGKLGDPVALPHLAQRYKIEPDPQLRDLIAKAGKHIQQVAAEQKRRSQELAAVSPAAQPQAPRPAIKPLVTPPQPAQRAVNDAFDEDDPPEWTPEPQARQLSAKRQTLPVLAPLSAPMDQPSRRTNLSAPVAPTIEVQPLPQAPVSERARRRAKGFLESAYAYQTSGDPAKATLMLARALRTDPDLKDEPGVRGLAMALVGGDGKNSIELVLDAAGRVKVGFALFDRELIDFVLAAALLFVVTIAFNVALFYGTSVLTLQIAAVFFGEGFDYYSLQRELAAYTVQTLIPETARTTSVTLLGTVFNLMIVYWVGTWMGGSGSLVRFLKVMLSWYTVFYFLLAAGLGAMVWGVFNPASGDFITVGILMLVGAVLLFLAGQVYLTSRVQEFSFINAAASVIVGAMVAGVIVNILGLFGIPLG